MKLRCLKFFAFTALAVSLSSSPPVSAQTFSTTPGSVSGLPGDIYVGAPPPFLPGDPLMLNVNALSIGRGLFEFDPFFALEFSIAAGSSGIPSLVPGFNMAYEESSGLVGGLPTGSGADEPADIYMETGLGGNILNADGDGVANPNVPTLGTLGLVEPFTTPGDDVDAWDNRPLAAAGSPAFFFSLDPAGAAAFGLGATAADILFWPGLVAAHDTPLGGGGTGIFAPGAAMGLMPGDDIDGLIYFDGGAPSVFDPGDVVLLSLAPGSPTLGAFGFSPADVLITSPGVPAPVLHRPAGAMGLLPTDNIDALDITEQFLIPEPGTMSLLVVGMTGLLAARRRRAS